MIQIPNSIYPKLADYLKANLKTTSNLDVISQQLSVFALSELWEELKSMDKLRLLIDARADLKLLGGGYDRAARNQILGPYLARRFSKWLTDHSDIRFAKTSVGGAGMFVGRGLEGNPNFAVQGNTALSTGGLGFTPNDQLNLLIGFDNPSEAEMPGNQFESFWQQGDDEVDANQQVLEKLQKLYTPKSADWLYAYCLHSVFDTWDDSAEDQVINNRIGFKDSIVWNKLYSFQKDGVVAALDRLNRYGGCIIADSVGLGKTFEALAVMKYYDARNKSILVLCPKRLRENWTLWTKPDSRNLLSKDRLKYTVLNHTDLSRDRGTSGDVDLEHIEWGNFDLVVIDESHNFRNKRTPRAGGETRYDKLLRRIVQEGARTHVLMLSATPVNNSLADLKNQIAFVTEGNDRALAHEGIPSIEAITRSAQKAFNRWLEEPKEQRTQAALVNRLGFGYFSLLDKLTIARSRKHVTRYYGTSETGEFPIRLPPNNINAAFDTEKEFPSIRSVSDRLRQLNLAAYTPLKYVHGHKQQVYDILYSQQVRDGKSVFRQLDREVSMVALMRMNLLKRLESSVSAFRLTVERQLEAVKLALEKVDSYDPDKEDLGVDDLDNLDALDEPDFQNLVVGKSIRVLLADMDRRRWRFELEQDRTWLNELLGQSEVITPARDRKLQRLKEVILKKVTTPINPDNNKVIVFTAFADTATYLYNQIAPWAKSKLGLTTGLVQGSGKNKTSLQTLGNTQMNTLLTAFSPRSKGRSDKLAEEGDLQLLIATDCISEGQNLQDCDFLINYDIHWNPVRIIQRFGRIDRLGSTNSYVQLVNFWPDVELEEYIGLEQRVSGRMKLLNISATGEEDVTERDSPDVMNDLDYRREQLQTMQNAVPDLDDLSGSISITDLSMSDFRMDLSKFLTEHLDCFDDVSLGAFTSVVSPDIEELPPGVVFCLRAETKAALNIAPDNYPLAPHYLVYVSEKNEIIHDYHQIKHILDTLKRLKHQEQIPASHVSSLEAAAQIHKRLQQAVSSLFGKGIERAVESLFSPGRTIPAKRGVAGINDFEVVAYMLIEAPQ